MDLIDVFSFCCFLSACLLSDASHNVAAATWLESENLDVYFERQVQSYAGTGALSRRKRNILFPSGVKLCAQETLNEAISHHLSYFHLRGNAAFHLTHHVILLPHK